MNLGIERIKQLSSEVKDPALLKIVNYLLSRLDMNEKYLNEEKSLSQMIKFIQSEARKKSQNGIAMIEDEIVYSWAIHYFDETNKKLNLTGIQKTKKEIDKVSTKTDKPTSKTQVKQKTWTAEGQLSLFD